MTAGPSCSHQVESSGVEGKTGVSVCKVLRGVCSTQHMLFVYPEVGQKLPLARGATGITCFAGGGGGAGWGVVSLIIPIEVVGFILIGLAWIQCPHLNQSQGQENELH